MSYLKELQDHYKAVKARLRANALPEVKLLPKPMPALLEREEQSNPQRAGLVLEGAEGKLVTEALRQANPEWIGGNHAQAIKIAKEMANAPKLPPLPGLVLNEIGAIRWMRVLHAVAAYHRIDPSEILGTSRKRHVAQARFEVFYRLRVDLNLSYSKIAGLMKKDHTTILHGVNRMREMLLDDLCAERDDGLLANNPPFASNTHNQSVGNP
jgi:hypothetical protein